ncbi:nuclear transport factor 2 family protein [Raoultella terrigena]|uniref:nuclear transport factor 2 family protein n=1 Tax=Raoultella terrigena TaxID=577 RepID=UPI003BF531EE
MSTMPSVINRFVEYYAGLDNQPPSALAALYEADATLIDPFGEHRGLYAIQPYFTHLLANVEHCRFSIDPPLCDGHFFVVTWTMHWSHPRIDGGAILTLPGCSVVKIQGEMITSQRDYYDAGEMIYEHLPLLGWAVRSVKRRVRP